MDYATRQLIERMREDIATLKADVAALKAKPKRNRQPRPAPPAEPFAPITGMNSSG